MLRRHYSVILTASLLVTAAFCSSPTLAQLIGPYPSQNAPCLSFADSPFNRVNFSSFCLETYEDHLFNVPGVSTSAGRMATVPETDSMTLLAGIVLLGTSFLLRRRK